jgi:hypothetical protein
VNLNSIEVWAAHPPARLTAQRYATWVGRAMAGAVLIADGARSAD